MGAAEHQRAANRKRVLLDDPAQARDPHRRAAYPGAVRARRAIHRSALHGRRPLRAGRHQRRDRPLPRRLPAVLRARRQSRDHDGRRPPLHRKFRPHRQGRPPSGPDAEPGRRRGVAAKLGPGAARTHPPGRRAARRAPRRQRPRRHAGRAGGQAGRRRPDAVGARARRLARQRPLVRRLRPGAKPTARGVFPRPPADGRGSGLLPAAGRHVAGGTGDDGAHADRQFRRLRRGLPLQQSVPPGQRLRLRRLPTPLLTFYNELHAQHRGRHEIFRGELVPCFETPARVDSVLAELGRRGLGRIVTPQGVPLMSLERVHTPRYLHFLRTAWSEWTALDPANAQKDAFPSVWPIRTLRDDIEPDNFAAKLGLYSMDSGSPLTAGTWTAAKTGADCAVNAAHALRLGERSTFVLSRPPGHHAGADFYGGYCFLNNAALAAQHLLDDGARRVAIIDLDYHHGNGTQSIFYGRDDVLFISLHADPRSEYPFYLGHADERGEGAGLGYNINLPLPAGTGASAWMAALETACIRLGSYAPDALVVSLGVDTFGGDPLSRFTLHSADYLRIGERLAYLGLPTAFIFEGGYAVKELGVNVVNVLEGFETAL